MLDFPGSTGARLIASEDDSTTDLMFEGHAEDREITTKVGVLIETDAREASR